MMQGTRRSFQCHIPIVSVEFFAGDIYNSHSNLPLDYEVVNNGSTVFGPPFFSGAEDPNILQHFITVVYP